MKPREQGTTAGGDVLALRIARVVSVPRAGSCAVLVVGPEGDLTPEELDALIAAGATPVGLGNTRLRVETAALALLAVVKACCEGTG